MPFLACFAARFSLSDLPTFFSLAFWGTLPAMTIKVRPHSTSAGAIRETSSSRDAKRSRSRLGGQANGTVVAHVIGAPPRDLNVSCLDVQGVVYVASVSEAPLSKTGVWITRLILLVIIAAAIAAFLLLR